MAHVDYFLKIEGVDGESTDDKHKGEIELESWSFGGTNPGSFSSGGGGGTGKVALSDFHFRQEGRQGIGQAVGVVLQRRAPEEGDAGLPQGRQDAAGIPDDHHVAGPRQHFQGGGSAGSDVVPMDQVSFNYGKIEFKYKEQKPDGSLGGEIIGGWDVTTNKVV